MRDPQILRHLGPDLKAGRLILSLDYRGDGFLGPAELRDHWEDWPARVIAMTLARVGSGAGPDLARLDEVKRHGRGRDVFAAGGVRGGDDLIELARRGIAGVLVASALHERRIGRTEIDAVAADAASS